MTVTGVVIEQHDVILNTAAPAAASQKVILDFTIPEQRQTEWCWAAVSVGIAAAYEDNPPEQCALATNIIGNGLQCCPDDSEPKCNVTQELPPPLGSNFLAIISDQTQFDFNFVKAQIDKGHPIAVRLESTLSGTGHFEVIGGYREVGAAV